MDESVQIHALGNRQAWEDAQVEGLPSQTWSYARALAESGLNPKLAVVECAGSRMLVPFVERSWKGAIDVATLPGLSGALIRSSGDVLVRAWTRYACAQDWVAGYLQLAPGHHNFLSLPDDTELVERTAILQLEPAHWALDDTPSVIIRRKVKSAGRQEASLVTDRAVLTVALTQLHPETVRQFGGMQFAAATIEQWVQNPANVVVGVAVNGHVQGVHLIQVWKDNAELHLVGQTQSGRALSALLYAAGIERLKERGVRHYNLGGAATGTGLFQFKKWLGGTQMPLMALRQIYDAERYGALCRQANAEVGGEWFPAYRAAPLALSV